MTRKRNLPNTTSPAAVTTAGFSAGLYSCSLAATKEILVSFFSSAY